MKDTWKPGTLIYPLPAILVSSGSTPDDYNMFTAAWVGTLCTNPPMCYVSIPPCPGVEVRSPYIEESPLSIECKVREIVALGSHDMFIADVVNVLADSKYIDPETQAFDMQRADLMVYSHGHYYELGNEICKFGWSVKKK